MPPDLEAQLAEPVRPLPRMVPPGETEEQRAVAAGSAAAQRLVQRPEYASVFQALVSFRQGYIAAYRRLHELLEAEPAEDRPPMVEDVFVGAAMTAAQQPFTEHEVVNNLAVVLHWMIEVLNAHVDADARQDRAEASETEKARRAMPVPVGFTAHPPVPDQEPDLTLGRTRALVLVGWQPALYWLMGQVLAKLLAETTMAVVHLLNRPPAAEESARYTAVARNRWEGAANTKTAFRRAMVDDLLGSSVLPPDLVLCDDLALAYTAGYTGRPRGPAAGDALKKLSVWCGAAGAACLAALPLLEPEVPELNGPEYEQLRTFATLRGLTVRELDGEYELTVGTGSVFRVPRAELDAHAVRRVIAP